MGRLLTREDLVATFRRRAAAPPKKENALLGRHLKCEETMHLANAIANAIHRHHQNGASALLAPSEMLPPLL